MIDEHLAVAGIVHRGRARFGMARILWHKGVNLDLAKELARQARQDYIKADKPFQNELDEVEAWLKEHVH